MSLRFCSREPIREFAGSHIDIEVKPTAQIKIIESYRSDTPNLNLEEELQGGSYSPAVDNYLIGIRIEIETLRDTLSENLDYGGKRFSIINGTIAQPPEHIYIHGVELVKRVHRHLFRKTTSLVYWREEVSDLELSDLEATVEEESSEEESSEKESSTIGSVVVPALPLQRVEYQLIFSKISRTIFGLDLTFHTLRPTGTCGFIFLGQYKFKFIQEQIGAPVEMMVRGIKLVRHTFSEGPDNLVKFHYRAERFM